MSSIKKQFVSGVFYTAVAKYIGLIIQLFIAGILSRLLTPGDFGVVAIATVFIVFFNLLSDVGIGVAIIQNKTLDKEEVESIFSFSIYMGLVLALIFFAMSGLIADFYNRPILKNICRLLSLSVLFSSLNVVPNGLLLREKQFKFIAIRTLLIQLVCGSIGVVAAFLGLGVYSLLLHAISSTIGVFLLNYAKHPLTVLFVFKRKALKKIYNYSIYQFFFNFINYFSRNLDTLLIGKFLSPAILGYYDKAYRLMLLPIENLTHVLSPVIHPLFSDFQKDKRRIFEGYLKIVKFLALVGFPLSAFLHFAAGEIILIIFGSQWQQAIPVFKILAWSVGIQVILSSSGAIFQAANQTRLLFISGLLSAIFMILGICYGVFVSKDLIGTAYGLLGAFLINFLQCYFILIRVLEGSFLEFISVFKSPVILFLLVLIGEGVFIYFIDTPSVIMGFVLKSIVASVMLMMGLMALGEFKQISSFVKMIVKR